MNERFVQVTNGGGGINCEQHITGRDEPLCVAPCLNSLILPIFMCVCVYIYLFTYSFLCIFISFSSSLLFPIFIFICIYYLKHCASVEV